MKKLAKSFVSFLREEDGVTAIEYGLIAALIAIVIIAALRSDWAKPQPGFHDDWELSGSFGGLQIRRPMLDQAARRERNCFKAPAARAFFMNGGRLVDPHPSLCEGSGSDA